jgi:thioredoxin-like negative regulator of GroEL
MTGPEHYTRAEQLLRQVRDGHQEGTDVAAILAAAQVHATLAQAAATALNDNAADSGGMPLEDYHAWTKAAGVWQPTPKGGDA